MPEGGGNGATPWWIGAGLLVAGAIVKAWMGLRGARHQEKRESKRDANTEWEKIAKLFEAKADECFEKHEQTLTEVGALRTELEIIKKNTAPSIGGPVSLTVNSKGRITQASVSATALTGYLIGELLFKPLIELMPARHQEAHLKGFARACAETASRDLYYELPTELLRKDGNEVPILVKVHGRRDEGEWTFDAILLPRE